MGDSTEGTVGAVIGGVIGYFAGGNVVAGAQIGYAIGSGIDARKDAKKSPRREPELQNKRTTAAEYGTPLPIAYGKAKVNGVLIWGKDLYQLVIPGSDDPGGKGGGGGGGSAGQSAAKYQTYARFAVKLCNGPIVGVSRLWLDDKLYLDARSSSTGAISQVGLGSTSGNVQSGKEEIAYSTSNGTVTIYTGTETQLPDSFMESIDGGGNVSAYRGDAYLVFQNLIVDPFGKRIPNVTAEVIVSGEISNDVYGPVTLSNFPPDTGEALLLIAAKSVVYDQKTGSVIFILSTSLSGSGANSENGYQVQSFNLATKAQIYNASVYGSSVGENGTTVYDRNNGIIWIKGIFSLTAVSSLTGATLTTWVLTGGAVFVSNSVMYNEARNQVWYTHTVSGTSYIYVADVAALFSGTSANSPTRTQAIGLGSSVEMTLVYIPHLQWIYAVADDSSRVFKIFDADGNTVYSGVHGSPADVIFGAYAAVDESSNSIWFVKGASAPRYLMRLDLATFAESTVRDLTGGVVGESTTALIDADSTSGVAIVYNDTTNAIEFIDTANTTVRSIDYTANRALYGVPDALCYIPGEQTLIVRAEVRTVLYYAVDRFFGSAEGLDAVVESIAEKVGVEALDIDCSAISASAVQGYAIDSRTQARAAVEPLKRIGFFDLVCEDGKVKAKKFGGSSVMTINYQDLLVPEDGDNKRPYSTKRLNELDLPQSFEVAYSDVDFDYETNLQTATRSTRRSKSKAIFTIPAAITGDAAKRSAEVAIYQTWAGRTSWILNGSRKHWALNIGDAFTFVDETGTSRRLLCTGREMLGMTRMTISAIEDDASVYSNTAAGNAPTWVPPVISASTLKRLDLLDIPILRDQDNYPGFYAIADSSAPSATLYESVDGGITYNSLGALQEASTGYATTTLANFTGGNVWDDVSTVTVTLYSGTLESVTDLQVLAGLNAALIGNEIIQYATATLVSANTYTLSRLLRGRKGTEWAIGAHGSGERFVPLTTSISRISSSARGALRYYKAVRSGASIADTPVIGFTNSQAGMKPYSVVSVAGSRDGSNNLTITWARRSRIGTAWGVTDALPLDDTVESYQVDIMSGSVVKRTISSSTPTCSYSAADQTTDFGGVQLSLLVNVYQMSTIVGRGTVSVKTI